MVRAHRLNWQQLAHGKPHREQDQVEMTLLQNEKQSLASHQGWLLELKSDLKPRQMIGLKDRTRLIVYLANLLTT